MPIRPSPFRPTAYLFKDEPPQDWDLKKEKKRLPQPQYLGQATSFEGYDYIVEEAEPTYMGQPAILRWKLVGRTPEPKVVANQPQPDERRGVSPKGREFRYYVPAKLDETGTKYVWDEEAGLKEEAEAAENIDVLPDEEPGLTWSTEGDFRIGRDKAGKTVVREEIPPTRRELDVRAQESWAQGRQAIEDEIARREAEVQAAEAGRIATGRRTAGEEQLQNIMLNYGLMPTVNPFAPLPPEARANPFQLSRLPGGELAMLQARRELGQNIPGFEIPYIDTSRGRVFAGTPEYGELARAGSKPTVPPLTEAQISAYTPGTGEHAARYAVAGKEPPTLPKVQGFSEAEATAFFDPSYYMTTGDEAGAIMAGWQKLQQAQAASNAPFWEGAFKQQKEQEKRKKREASFLAAQPMVTRRRPFWQRA